MGNILKQEKKRQEKYAKKYENECEFIFSLVSKEMIKNEWCQKQATNFISNILPEYLRIKNENHTLKVKYQDIVLGELEK